MAERSTCHVHTQGDEADILFQLPPLSRLLREGDTLTVTPLSGPDVQYKVETVKYHLTQLASANPNNPHNFWKSPEVLYGVSIVP